MRSISAVIAVLVVAVTMTGCGTSRALSHGGPVRDHVSFVDNLRGHGVVVDVVGATRQPFLRPPGTRLRLTGDGLSGPATVESYNYDSTDLGTDGSAAAAHDAAGISPDGTPKTGRRPAAGPLHFFRADRVIVIYAGSDTTATTLLTSLLGPQFAGQ